MAQLFIDKVGAIVAQNLSNENFGTSELATQLGLSNSQTLRKVKAATGKSVNQYIREFRLEKAAILIKKTDATIAEISYQVGFSSPSYFNKAFRKYYGVAPGEYKAKIINLNESYKTTNRTEVKYKSMSKRTLLIVFTLLLVSIFGFLEINQLSSKNDLPSNNELPPNSIAVLPFKDLSPKDNQWFSDGISDNILHALAQIKDLSVTSFTSSSTYRDTDKKIPQIANELGVFYILEGSVTLVDGEIKIITQLIDSNDKHIWSKEYNDNFDNVISIQNNVALEVTKQLKNTLNQKDQDILTTFPTENMEAYHLYLEGKRLNASFRFDDLQKNIKNNMQAIALDSNFIEAYEEVAMSRMLLGQNWGDNLKNSAESSKYVEMILVKDPNSGMAYAVKASLNDTKPIAEEYFEKAILLSPNNSEFHNWYSTYLRSIEKAEKSLYFARIAHRLNPMDHSSIRGLIWCLIINNKLEEAEDYIEKYRFVFRTKERLFTNEYSIILRRHKNWEAVLDWLNNKQEEEPKHKGFWLSRLAEYYIIVHQNKTMAYKYALEAYEVDSSFLHWFIEFLLKQGFLSEAENIITSEEFKSLKEWDKNYLMFEFYYYNKEYSKCLDLINETKVSPGVYEMSRLYAQLGDIEKYDSVYRYANGSRLPSFKSIAKAALKERDSMYFYLNKSKYHFDWNIPYLIQYPEFDAYRNEPRFKDLLKESFLLESRD